MHEGNEDTRRRILATNAEEDNHECTNDKMTRKRIKN